MLFIKIMAGIAALFSGVQLLASCRIRKIGKAMREHRRKANTHRATIRESYRQEEQRQRRLREIYNNPEISESPEFEIRSCKTYLANMPEYRAMTESEVRRHSVKAKHAIRKIRFWQKLLIKH